MQVIEFWLKYFHFGPVSMFLDKKIGGLLLNYILASVWPNTCVAGLHTNGGFSLPRCLY